MKKVLVIIIIFIVSLFLVLTLKSNEERAICSDEPICEKWRCEDGHFGCTNWEAYCDTRGKRDNEVCPASVPYGHLQQLPLSGKVSVEIKCHQKYGDLCGQTIEVDAPIFNQLKKVRLCKTRRKNFPVKIHVLDAEQKELIIYIDNNYAENENAKSTYLVPMSQYQSFEFPVSLTQSLYPCGLVDMDKTTEIFSEIFQ